MKLNLNPFANIKPARPDPKYAWTEGDNLIAAVELELANYLTRELNKRPELSLQVLYKSRPIQQHTGSILAELELKLGKEVKAHTESWRNAEGSRAVTVRITNRW